MKDNIIFSITIEDLQDKAMEKIGRKLTEEEIEIAKDGFEWGMDLAVDITYNTIFTEMI
jgi:hypothetical protein